MGAPVPRCGAAAIAITYKSCGAATDAAPTRTRVARRPTPVASARSRGRHPERMRPHRIGVAVTSAPISSATATALTPNGPARIRNAPMDTRLPVT